MEEEESSQLLESKEKDLERSVRSVLYSVEKASIDLMTLIQTSICNSIREESEDLTLVNSSNDYCIYHLSIKIPVAVQNLKVIRMLQKLNLYSVGLARTFKPLTKKIGPLVYFDSDSYMVQYDVNTNLRKLLYLEKTQFTFKQGIQTLFLEPLYTMIERGIRSKMPCIGFITTTVRLRLYKEEPKESPRT